MFLDKSLYFVFTVFVFCESAFVDNLKKCKIDDGVCAKETIQSVLIEIAKTGVPELGIPIIDPIDVNDVSVSIADVVDFKLVKGTVKGVKDCVINKFASKIKEGRVSMDLTCDLIIKGQYKVFSSNPLVKSFFGGDSLRGDGNGKVKIDKLKLRINYDTYVERRDGELYIRCNPEKNSYTYDIGKMTFATDSLYIGKTESSKVVVELLNQNWKLFVAPMGKPFMDKAMEYVTDFIHKFFNAVPTRYYIIDDLSRYAIDG